MKKTLWRAPFALVGLVVVTLVVAPLQVGIAAADETPDGLEVMGDYSPSDYVAEASTLPDELVDAIDRDLGLTAEEYLAQSDAAVQATDVVASLEDAGVAVLGSNMDGTYLVVNVASEADAATVETTGAQAVIGEPDEWVLPDLPITSAQDIYGGQGITWNTGSSNYLCSLGFNGYLVSSGQSQLVTAGHCTNSIPAATDVKAVITTAPGGGSVGSTIGQAVAGTTMLGGGADVGRVGVTGSGMVGKPAALTWGGGMGAPLASTPQSITRISAAIVDASICKSGATSGWTCGTIEAVDSDATVDVDPDVPGSGFHVNSVVASICVLPGDSGGTALSGSAGVGITSWRIGDSTKPNEQPDVNGVAHPTCASTLFGGFYAAVSSGSSISTVYGSTWEPAVSVSTPTVSFAGTGALTTTISGTLPNASSASKVNVYFDGSSTPVTVSASAGSWSAPLSGLASGIHSYRVEGQYGTWSKGASLSGYFTKSLTVARISGSDRYDTSAEVAQKFTTADTVYIASGLNYPDALSAAPAAASKNVPLMLVPGTFVTPSVADELTRLAPTTVILVGSPSVVSNAVGTQIASLLPGVIITRLAGADRYATSRIISEDAFPAASNAFVATGTNFPDALAASAAAATLAGPVILVYGPGPTTDAATQTTMANMGVTRALIAGSTAVVSQGIQNRLIVDIDTVTRLAGSDRYSTGVAINTAVFTTATDAYLATGEGYADALAGAALAGRDSAPLFVVPGTCVPAAVLSAMVSMGVQHITLLGGASVLSANVFALKQC